MNLLILEPDELDADGRVQLVGRRAEHLVKVLRVTADDTVRAGLLHGGAGTAHVEAVDAIDKKAIRVTLRVEIAPGSAPRPPLDLVLALPRPAALHRVLQHAATLGVGNLDLINAWRVEKSYFQSPSLEDEAIGRHLRLGLEQGQRTWLPQVQIHRRLVPFVESLAPTPGQELAPEEEVRLLAHPDAAPIESVLEGARPGRLRLAIGPEGGWLEREIETFAAAGFKAVSLGPWILRSEAAVTAAVAQVAVLRRLADSRP